MNNKSSQKDKTVLRFAPGIEKKYKLFSFCHSWLGVKIKVLTFQWEFSFKQLEKSLRAKLDIKPSVLDVMQKALASSKNYTLILTASISAFWWDKNEKGLTSIIKVSPFPKLIEPENFFLT